MAKYDDGDGVWRTVGGRRIFIKTGQSLPDAMKQSGKFVSAKGKKNINNGQLGKEYRDKLENLKGKEDGTYNLDTGEKVEFNGVGYNVSFQQTTDNYTNKQYYDKITECREMCDGNVYGGVFGGVPEISFYTKDLDVAIKIMKKYNQHSIWDNSIGDVIMNEDYDEKANPTNYGK